jgi:hypothetical protein
VEAGCNPDINYTTTTTQNDQVFFGNMVNDFETACSNQDPTQFTIYTTSGTIGQNTRVYSNSGFSTYLPDGMYLLTNGALIVVVDGIVTEYYPNYCG